MLILKGSKCKFIPTSGQAQMCENYAGINRKVYNAALEQRRLAYQLCRKSLFYEDQASELKELKEAFPYLKEAPSQTIQQSLKDLQIAFDRFFRGLAAYPTVRRKFVNDAFRFPTPTEFRITRVSKRKGTINLPKLGVCKFWWNSISGKPKSATVTKEAGTWYISILCETTIPDPIQMAPEIAFNAVGLDRGCSNLLGCSNPVFEEPSVPSPQWKHLSKITTITNGHLASLRKDVIEKYESKIIRNQRILAFKKKGSQAFKRVKKRISGLHRRLKNYRLDALHQFSTWIVENQDIIFVENLDVRAMTKSNKGTMENPGSNVKKKSSLNKNILTQGWGYLRIFLNYKAKWLGKLFDDETDPAYTSQKCYICKYINKNNRKGDMFLCLRCNHEDHSDINAAKNILRDGLSRITSESEQLRLLRFSGTSLLRSTI